MHRRKRAQASPAPLLKGVAMYQRKTKDEYQIQVRYGERYGWEHETTESTWKEAKEQRRVYRENAPQYPVRIVKKRVPLMLLAGFLTLGSWGCAAPCKAPADLVTVAQYPDGTFSVDVYAADGALATTAHLPSDARMSDAFPKGDPQ
jgi:hypothetical protein